MNIPGELTKYEPLTLKHMLGLAAPQTWAATLAPVLVAGAYSLNLHGKADILLFYLTLIAALLMQSSANILNDYYDYKKGTDNLHNSPDPQEAILVYQHLRPLSVLMLAMVFLGTAGFIGLYITFRCGLVPLSIGCVGGVVILLYSGGLLPISYLPIGELVSGTVMGGLLPMAVVYVLTGELDVLTFCHMIPLMLGIGLIMYTNNISDIEKDTSVGRKTLSVCLGRKKARILYFILLAVWFLSIGHMTFWYFQDGFFLYPLLLGFAGKEIVGLMKLSFLPSERGQAMSGITKLNLCTGCFYAVMILTDGYFFRI